MGAHSLFIVIASLLLLGKETVSAANITISRSANGDEATVCQRVLRKCEVGSSLFVQSGYNVTCQRDEDVQRGFVDPWPSV